MPDRMDTSEVDIDVVPALTHLEHAASLLEQVQDAHDYEQGTAFAVKSIAHSVLHMAHGSGVIEPMALRVLAVKWERLARDAKADDEASDAAVRGVFAQCAGEVRALLGDVR